mgnify:FL=1|tara:strand:+ start:1855 stop:2319 length:465 start_codon:yes stop_codon:yes gene_type:complete
MSYEPFYQSQGPSQNEVISYINNIWICKQLNLSENTYEETQILKNKYNTTFDAIRLNNPEWKNMLEQIIEEEVVKGKGTHDSFGSYHGYHTFVHGQITKNVEERIIREIWLPYYLNIKITAIYRLWIHNRFAPGGRGYQEAMDDFNELKKINII